MSANLPNSPHAPATFTAARPAPRARHAAPGHWLYGLIAAAAFAAGSVAALHYPIAPYAAGTIFGLLSVLAFRFPLGWLAVLFALLPVVGFAPWTGWLTFEETDLLVLAAAAGGYARRMQRPAPTAPGGQRSHRPRRGLPVGVGLLLALFTASVLVAMGRGFADAGGFQFGWFQGYHEPMNSVRLAKSFLLALLLLPLWLANERDDPQGAQRWLLTGLTAGLAAGSLAAVWERIAFTGLLDFSTDYRTTALFWEMHVGGVALESFLAATLPFALTAMFRARTSPGWAAAAAAATLGAYATVTSFSRGAYLAVSVGIVVMLALHLLQQHRLNPPGPHRMATPYGGAWAALLLLLGFAAAAAWMFPTSGYRGLLALMGVLSVWLVSSAVWTRMGLRLWAAGMALGGALSALGWLVSSWLPKGAYLVLGLEVMAALALAFAAPRYRDRAPLSRGAEAVGLLGLYLASATALAQVAMHWGGAAALQDTVPVLAALALLMLLSGVSPRPLVPASLRWQGAMVGAMLFATLVVGAFSGGAYMAGRISSGGRDLDERVAHWKHTLDMLTTPADWAIGKGMGRFPANFYVASMASASAGDYRIAHQDANSFARLSAGSQQASWGTLLRITQRIAAPVGPPLVRLNVRTDKGAQLLFEVCEKHLLYSATCLAKGLKVEAGPGRWQTVQLRPEGTLPSRGAWFAPALISFSFSLANPGDVADVDNVELIDADGRDLLANGDFSQEMARWFFSSDLNHRPWHIQNMGVNLLFEQGAAGLLLFGLLFVVALWRVGLGQGRDHPLAPAAAGALAGIAVVGLFDTLLDAPRVAMLCYFVLLLALVVRSPRPAAPAARAA